MTTADGLGDRQETSGRGDRVIRDKLVPFDLQQLSLALHMESLEGSGINQTCKTKTTSSANQTITYHI